MVRAEIEPGVFARVKNARTLSLECRPPAGDAAKAFFARYLADPSLWQQYKNLTAVAIPFEQLLPETQRMALLTIFPEDVVTIEGWWHQVQFAGAEGLETVWTLCEWLTGKGTDYKLVAAHARNRLGDAPLQVGQRIFIPADLLRPNLKIPTPDRLHLLDKPKPPPKPAPKRPEETVVLPGDEPQPPKDTQPPAEETAEDVEEAVSTEEPYVYLTPASSNLTFGEDDQGPYALYELEQGEALYTAVVVRFTYFTGNTESLEACDIIMKRSRIRDVSKMKTGQKVYIPLDMLADRYQPEGSERRKEYEEALLEADRLKQDRVTTRDLAGIVVVLDPGHGGRDQGAANDKYDLLEDELNYDIVCRIKRILETKTGARVYVTAIDPDQKHEPSTAKKSTHDTDEHLLTTPQYENTDAHVSANLRWYLANSIYRGEVKKGTDSRKIVFTSIHADALFNEKLRGAMIYIPGAKYRRDSEEPSGSEYGRYREAKEQRCVKTTAAERRRDEALSRNFADALLAAMAKHDPPIMRHSASDPVRSQIRQSGGKVYVPAVLRNTLIPTKVLIETANMTNATDCQHLADPKWREWFAEAYVDALRSFFGS
ncbi:MAG: MurNAc-LAA protein [Candidatus Hydrogenedentes bacterium]|nr:MurNAc-LAA protein [Candidatus Hydrogenedentota bacterium]